MNDGRFDEAAGLYGEMLKARPNDPGLLMNLGMALAMAGREAEAIDPLERAIRLRPSLGPAHMFLGSSYLALGEPEKAVAPLERAAAARPTDAERRSGCSRRRNSPPATRSARSREFRKLSELGAESAGRLVWARAGLQRARAADARIVRGRSAGFTLARAARWPTRCARTAASTKRSASIAR